jgi:plastocyanin
VLDLLAFIFVFMGLTKRTRRLLDLGVQPMIFKPGDSTSFRFTTAGTHAYDCSFHPRDMHGEVVVTAAK